MWGAGRFTQECSSLWKPKRTSSSLELEFQMVGSCPIWVPGAELWASQELDVLTTT